MQIPKKIENLLERRYRLAMELISTSCEVDEWLENHGADLNDPDICDSTLTGACIYCEPETAKKSCSKIH